MKKLSFDKALIKVIDACLDGKRTSVYLEKDNFKIKCTRKFTWSKTKSHDLILTIGKHSYSERAFIKKLELTGNESFVHTEPY
jgi:hypothetical protein